MKPPIYIDIDGILTNETEGHDYKNRTPCKGNINIVNRLYKAGYGIILWTSRYGLDDQITRDWLRKYGVKYNDIIYDKPKYSLLIDDLSTNTFDCDVIKELLGE